MVAAPVSRRDGYKIRHILTGTPMTFEVTTRPVLLLLTDMLCTAQICKRCYDGTQ